MITNIPSVDEFAKILSENPGLIVIKFGAEWCGPCKKIEPQVEHWFSTAPTNVVCGKIDIDINFEIYAFLKKKRVINGVPAIFCYKQGNVNYIPDDMVVGADSVAINNFFNRCVGYLPK